MNLKALLTTCLLLNGQAFLDTCCAQDVRYSLAAYAPNTRTKLTSVKVDQTFDVAVIVQDLRPNETYRALVMSRGRLVYADFPKPRGVFSAYVNLAFDEYTANLQAIKFTSPIYVNGRHKSVVPHGVNELGAFAGSSPVGKSAYEVCRISLWALQEGELVITPNVDGLENHPAYKTLLYGVPGVDYRQYPTAVPIDRIVCLPLKVVIE